MGFTAYDSTNAVLIERPPVLTQDDGFIIIGKVHRLRFHSDTNDAFMGYITVMTSGGKQEFDCVNCPTNSQSTSLNLLHLNSEGTTSDIPLSTSCISSCDFYQCELCYGQLLRFL